jgi:hypothetical protein
MRSRSSPNPHQRSSGSAKDEPKADRTEGRRSVKEKGKGRREEVEVCLLREGCPAVK